MGACLGRCLEGKRDQRRYRQQRTLYFQEENIVEFDCLVDSGQSPKQEKHRSISTLLSMRKRQYTRHEEELELEEEHGRCQGERSQGGRGGGVGASEGGVRVETVAHGRGVITRSRGQLLSRLWAERGKENFPQELDDGRLQLLNPHSLVTQAGLIFQGSQVSGSNGLGRDRANSTPASSIDLEWENEGLFPPPAVPTSAATEEDLLSWTADSSSAPVRSRGSSPNSLEWDTDDVHPDTFKAELPSSAQYDGAAAFPSVLPPVEKCASGDTVSVAPRGLQYNSYGGFVNVLPSSPQSGNSDVFLTDLDLETEQLISEIERLTSRALQETGQGIESSGQ